MSRLSTRLDRNPGTPLKSRKSRPGTPDSRLSLALKSRPAPVNNEESNIRVYVRCRGRNDREIAENSTVVVSTAGSGSAGHKNKEITVLTGPNTYTNKSYTFDRVFGPESDQNMVYDEVADGVLHEVIAGYNCTIFAYGQTGTGKTYTMSGDLDSDQGRPVDKSGIIPRILHNLKVASFPAKSLTSSSITRSCEI
jgi:kinesin family member 11